jgi:CrcB protein
MNVLLVFLGGGVGASIRYLLATAVPGAWGTLVINVLGSAALAALAHPAVNANTPARLLLGTGLLGGFTTYSTFNLDIIQLVLRGRAVEAGLLAASTLAGCLLAATATWAAISAVHPQP